MSALPELPKLLMSADEFLSWDARQPKEAVTFLVRVKECLEDPQRFMLEL